MTRPLQAYEPGEFERLHAAGAMLLTASSVAAIFGLSPWASPFSLAMHLSGQHPLPEPDHVRITMGRRLERVGLEMLEEELDCAVSPARGYWRHDTLPLLASPDGIAVMDYGKSLAPVEVKVLSPQSARAWIDGPPMHVVLQHQTQLMLGEAATGFIVALTVGDNVWSFTSYPTEAHAGAQARILETARHYMANLARGELPEPSAEPDAKEAAAMAALWQPEAAITVQLDEPEAVERFERLLQAKADRIAAEKTEEACRRWFQTRIGNAGRALIGNAREIGRKTSKVKARPAIPATTMTRWSFKSHDSEDED